jgi:hypothetical protein
MWTEITRSKYERKGVGYSSDLGDAEWAIIEHGYRNAIGWAGRRRLKCAVLSMRCFIWCGPIANGVSCPASSRLIRLCSIISMLGATAACWIGSISSCCCKRAKRRLDESPVPQRASSTANRSRPPRPAARAVSMPRRKSKGASATSSLTPPASWSELKCCADVQDRDGAPLVIAAIHDLFPWLRHLFADSAYAGDKLRNKLRKFR